MAILGLLIVILLIGGGVVFVAHVVKAAQEAGALTATPKTGTRAARARVTARNTPQNVRAIFAQAYADNWVAKRADQRKAKAAAEPAGPPATPKPARRPLLQRLVFPAASPAAGADPPAPAAPNATVTPIGANGSRPSPGSARYRPPPATPPRPVPVPDPSSGRTGPMPTTAPPSAAPTGAAADMFSAANVLNGHAKAGGIHGKLRAQKVYAEALAHIASALKELGRDMSETGRYPSMVWESVMTASAQVQAASMSMGEGANSLTSLMNMPVGELASSSIRAPHHDELNRA